MSMERIEHFGGDGGREFPMTPIVGRIGLRSQHLVDQIRINGIPYYKENGIDQGDIILAKDEYISRVDIRYGEYVDYVKFSTNKGQTKEGGDPNAGVGGKSLKNIRVLAIGGKADASVDRLNIWYVEDYQPSVVVEDNATFILEFKAPSEKITTYETAEQRKAESFERSSSTQQTIQTNASVEAEYYVKAVVSTGIELKWNHSETYRKDLETKKTSGKETIIELDANHVGVKLVEGTIMKGSDDIYWMYPTGPSHYLNWRINDVERMLGKYDLTGFLYDQMDGFDRSLLNEKYGFTYYGKPR